MEELEGLELISEKEKGIIDNCDQIIYYCENYKKKVIDLRRNLQQIRQTPQFRKEYYKALNVINSLYSHTNEFMLELELSSPLENERDFDIIEVPCLPTDGESQNQQFEMLFLHGSSPWNFWLTHCEENITRRLKELLQKRANNLQELVEKPICGDYVLYKQGAHLQRAVVQKTLSSDRYHILDIDNGATALIRLKRLYKMDEEIGLIPYQAVNCFLIQDSEDSSLWNKEVQEIFSSTLKRCKLTVKIIEKNPGYPTSFFVNLKAEDIDDDTELTVDVGKWITKRVIPELKSRSSLRVSVLDAFFNEGDDENDSTDESNDKSGDDSSENQPITYNSACSSDREEADTSKENGAQESGKIISVEMSPVTTATDNSQTFHHRMEEVCASKVINSPTSEKLPSKIAANFQAKNSCSKREYPINPPNAALMPSNAALMPSNAALIPSNAALMPSNAALMPSNAALMPSNAALMSVIIPISPNEGSMRGYPVPPNVGSMIGYPVIKRSQNVESVRCYPINPRPPLTGSMRRYPIDPRPPNPGSTNSWSSNANDYNAGVNHRYQMPKHELKTPVVLVHPKDELRAMCTYVVSPNEFYVHLVNKNNTKIDVLGTDLEEFYTESTAFNYYPGSGSKYCACNYIWHETYPNPPRTTWFRAEIITLEWDKAQVFLVDYGVKIWRNMKDLRILDQRFFVYDKMAQRCHLHSVPILENKDYSQEVNEYFKSHLKSLLKTKDNVQLIVENNSGTGYGSSLAVVMKHPHGDGYINDDINELIKSKDGKLLEQNEWDPMSEDFYADTNRMDHVIDNPLMATGGYIPKHEERVCKFFSESGRCPKKACRQEHVFMGEDVFTVDTAVTYGDTFSMQILPEEGSKLKVKMLICISPTRFYAHWMYDNVMESTNKSGKYKYEDDEIDDDVEDDDEEEEETLKTLMNALNLPENTKKYKFLEGGLPAVGEMVIVNRNDIWYRARVSEVDEKFCYVFLIDFGNEEEIPVNCLRVMEPRFLHLPAQATEFCVAEVQALEDKWSPDEDPTSILSQWENTCLYAYVMKRDIVNRAVEVKLTDTHGDSLRSKLVKTGKYRSFDMKFGEDSHLIPG